MKDKHEKIIMDILLQMLLIPAVINITGIVSYTKIPRSTLQRILPRLEKRGWIEKNTTKKIIGAVPYVQIDEISLNIYRDVSGNRIFINLDTTSEEFKEDLKKLSRQKIHWGKNGREIIIESYQEVLESYDPRKQSRILREGGLRFKGKKQLLEKYNDTLQTYQSPKQVTYYEIKKYPYLVIKNNKLKIDLKSDFNIPYRKKRFWKKSAKVLIDEFNS